MRPDRIGNPGGAGSKGLSRLFHLGLIAEDLEHLGAADRTGTGHCPALPPAFPAHGHLLGTLHLALGAALYAICFCHMLYTLDQYPEKCK